MSVGRKTTLSEALGFFTYYLEANDASPATVDAYTRDLKLLVSVLDNPLVDELTPGLLDTFFADARVKNTRNGDGEPRSKASVNRIKGTVKSFCKWLVNSDACNKNAARLIKIKNVENNSPDTFTADQLKKLRKTVAAKNGAIANRDKIMLELLAETGVRISELVGLNIEDIDLDNKKITVKVKGGKTEQRFINAPLRRLIFGYLKKRTAIFTEEGRALFLSTHTTRITTRQVERRFKIWLEWSGIGSEKFTVHSMRHTFATQLMKKTKNLLLVSKALGHKNIQTTTVYAKLADDEIENALEKV